MFDVAIRSHAVRLLVDGKDLEVATFEPAEAQGPTIVLLHEGLGSVALWKAFPAQLAERTRRIVVAYSRYGHGRSDILREKRDVDYMHREGEVVLPELLAQLHLERPVLFGHSDGASIALIFAGTYADAVAGLILEAPHVFVEDQSIRAIAEARTAFRTTSLPEKLARYHADARRTFWGWNDIWLDPRFRNWNIESYARRVTCPTLLVQGAVDEYGTSAQIDAIAVAVPGSAAVMFEGCGHAPHRDRTQATLAAAAAFIAALPETYGG